MATVFDQNMLKDILLNNVGVEGDMLDGFPAVTLGQLGVDSVAVLELQVILNEQFGVTIDETVVDLPLAGIVELVNAR